MSRSSLIIFFSLFFRSFFFSLFSLKLLLFLLIPSLTHPNKATSEYSETKETNIITISLFVF